LREISEALAAKPMLGRTKTSHLRNMANVSFLTSFPDCEGHTLSSAALNLSDGLVDGCVKEFDEIVCGVFVLLSGQPLPGFTLSKLAVCGIPKYGESPIVVGLDKAQLVLCETFSSGNLDVFIDRECEDE
jgi:hypothetical protein